MDNNALVDYLIKSSVLKTKKIIDAFRKTDRKHFFPEDCRGDAYRDSPAPTKSGQTISQPSVVAIMTELLSPESKDKVLEIGTGSGYQAALLSEICRDGKIYTIEKIPELFKFATENLRDYKNVKVFLGDGSKGLPREAPFDKIIVTAAAPRIPYSLVEQLKPGGKIVIPVGSRFSQKLVLAVKQKDGKLKEEESTSVVFVPLIGRFGFKF